MTLFESIGLALDKSHTGSLSIADAVASPDIKPMSPRGLLLDPLATLFLDPNLTARNLMLTEHELSSFYIPSLLAAASCYQLVPASEYSHHSHAGGLFLHSVQTGIRLMNELDAVFLTTENRHPNRVGIVRSSIKAFGLAVGICHDAGKLTHDLKIRGSRDGQWIESLEYSVETGGVVDEPLYAWLVKNHFDRYSFTFREGRKVGGHSVGAFSAAMSLLKKLGVPLTDDMRQVLIEQTGHNFKRVLEELKLADMWSIETARERQSGAAHIAPQLSNALIYANERGLLGELKEVRGRLFISNAAIQQAVQNLPDWDDFSDVRNAKSFAHSLIASGVATAPKNGKRYSYRDGVEGVEIPLHTGLAYALLQKAAYPDDGGASLSVGAIDDLCRTVDANNRKRRNTRLLTFILHLLDHVNSGGAVDYAQGRMKVHWADVLNRYYDKHPRAQTIAGDLNSEGLLASHTKTTVTISSTPADLLAWTKSGG